MEPLKNHTGLVVTLDRANVDTDQIIAKQFLKSIKRTGFGEFLFYDWRFQENGKPNADFPLNQPRFKGASILVARNNFGCGSSREHAVWAVQQYGFKVVIAPSMDQNGSRIPGFADIFKNNCSKNSLLTIELSSKEVDQIFALVEKNPGLQATVDLPAQTITFNSPQKVSFRFEIDAAVKERLIGGLDDIGITLKYTHKLSEYEKTHTSQKTW